MNKSLELTAEGKEVAERGSHEALVYHVIPPDGIAQAEIMVGFCHYRLFFFALKMKNFNYGYTLEPPKHIFFSKNKNKMFTPVSCIPQFYFIKVWYKELCISRTCFHDMRCMGE